jgi:hypothetical protein
VGEAGLAVRLCVNAERAAMCVGAYLNCSAHGQTRVAMPNERSGNVTKTRLGDRKKPLAAVDSRNERQQTTNY